MADTPRARAEGQSQLLRAWWFPSLPERPGHPDDGTYSRFPLDDQPRLDDRGDPLAWLDGAPEHDEWGIGESDIAPVQDLSIDGLQALAPDGVVLPRALVQLAQRPQLQARIRSATACYLDLANFTVRTTAGGHLLHLLSDQQWVRHWFVLLDGAGSEIVCTSEIPFGFELSSDDPYDVPDPVPLDGSCDLEVCADSVSEFLHRFWIENEIYFTKEGQLPSSVTAYATLLRSRGSRPDGGP